MSTQHLTPTPKAGAASSWETKNPTTLCYLQGFPKTWLSGVVTDKTETAQYLHSDNEKDPDKKKQHWDVQ